MRLPFEGKDFGCKHHLFATVVRKLELIFVDAGHVICIISHIFLTWNNIYTHYQSVLAIYQTETHYLQTRNSFLYKKRIWKVQTDKEKFFLFTRPIIFFQLYKCQYFYVLSLIYLEDLLFNWQFTNGHLVLVILYWILCYS